MEIRTTHVPFIVILIGLLLSGCSVTQRIGSWFGVGDSESGEIAFVPPSTVAPSEKRVYESESYRPEGGGAAASPSEEWGLEEIETDSNSEPTAETTVGDIGFVKAPPSAVGPDSQPIRTGPSTPGVHRGGRPAPRIRARTMDGRIFDSADHLGKVVLVDFWFSKCGPCLRALPHVDRLRKTHSKDRLTIVAVNHDRKKSIAVDYLRRNPHDWPQIYDREQRTSLVKRYGVKLFPTFVVIDQAGNIQYQGNSVSAASAKVAELIRIPSLPASVPSSGVVAAGPRAG